MAEEKPSLPVKVEFEAIPQDEMTHTAREALDVCLSPLSRDEHAKHRLLEAVEMAISRAAVKASDNASRARMGFEAGVTRFLELTKPE